MRWFIFGHCKGRLLCLPATNIRVFKRLYTGLHLSRRRGRFACAWYSRPLHSCLAVDLVLNTTVRASSIASPAAVMTPVMLAHGQDPQQDMFSRCQGKCRSADTANPDEGPYGNARVKERDCTDVWDGIQQSVLSDLTLPARVRLPSRWESVCELNNGQ